MQKDTRYSLLLFGLYACKVSAVVSAAIVLAIFFFLLWFSFPLLHWETFTLLASWDWRPFEGHFGVLPMVVGSLLLTIPSVLLAFPVSIGICCFVHGLGPPRLARLVLQLVKLMTSVPTVVYGFVGIFILVPLVRNIFLEGSGFSLLAAIIALAVLILPTVVLMLHSQFLLIEPQVKLTAMALGMTPVQRLLYLVIPSSGKGFAAAGILGLGRALGDTLISLMLAGNAPQVPGSLFDSIRTMTAHIALVIAADSQSLAYLSLFACGLLLFLSTILVNLGLRFLGASTKDIQ